MAPDLPSALSSYGVRFAGLVSLSLHPIGHQELAGKRSFVICACFQWSKEMDHFMDLVHHNHPLMGPADFLFGHEHILVRQQLQRAKDQLHSLREAHFSGNVPVATVTY